MTQPVDDPDATLVARTLRDPQAYGAIVRRFEAVLRRYVKRLLGQHGQAADDVVQDVFIKAYVNLNDYDPARALGPWLYRIAHNEAVSYLRKRGREPSLIEGEDAQLILAKLRDESAFGAASLPDSSVQQALYGLEPRYRDVLLLRYVEDKSYDEISDILQMPPGTVATRIRRGLERLKSSLAKWNGSGGRLGFYERA